jgi:FkbM family methyltransferase
VNVGQTLLKIKSISPDVGYYGFEPNPSCIYYLNQLVDANKFCNVQIFPFALAEKAEVGELNFFFDSDTDSAATVIRDFRPGSLVKKKVYIPCFSFNEMASYIDEQAVAIIKIDVEGAELEVLKGLHSFLNTSRPFVVVEILPVYQQSNQTRFERQIQIEKLINRYNYKILRVKKTTQNTFDRFELIENIGIHGNEGLCDYVLCPQEHIQNLAG